MKKMIVAAIDVGKYDNLGVYITDKDDISPDTFFSSFIDEVKNKKGAIGFEAPLFIPTGDMNNMTKSRWAKIEGKEQNIDSVCGAPRPWSITNSFHCVIPLLDIFFLSLKDSKIPIFTDHAEFEKSSTGVLIFEAFISGGRKDLTKESRKKYIKDYYRKKRTGTDKSKYTDKDIDIDSHNHDAKYACELYINVAKEMKKGECTTRCINVPSMVAQRNGIKLTGSTNKGLIVRSPKPCFVEKKFTDGVVIDLSWDR